MIILVLLCGQIRQRDWSLQGQSLKVRINRKLSIYQAAARLHIKTLTSLNTEGKSWKRLLHGALALLIEVTEACLFSAWRKLRACEELFGCLLSGISQAAAVRSGQLLRVLLIRFKPLVLATCAQVNLFIGLICDVNTLMLIVFSCLFTMSRLKPHLKARDVCLRVS